LDNTEEKILTAATRVFQRQGYSGARMDKLAKEAGVNKALLNYYYRSKEKLFQKVFELSMKTFIQKLSQLLQSDLPLDMKIYKAVDLYTRMLLENPELPLFIISEIREFPLHVENMLQPMMEKSLVVLEKQLEEAHQAGQIKRTTVYTFMMNLLGLTVFPFVVAPLALRLFGMDAAAFKERIIERKKQLPEMIIQTLKT
jgi:TetR/AcrR family transcriptional regulator